MGWLSIGNSHRHQEPGGSRQLAFLGLSALLPGLVPQYPVDMRHLGLVLVFGLVLMACGDDDAVFSTTVPTADATAASSTVPPTAPATTLPATTTTLPSSPTTAAPSTTAAPATTAPTTPTTVAGAPFTSGDYGFFPAPLGTAADGHGSGCIHAPGTLTDGMWFGFVEAIGGGAVTFDMGCFFTGPAAVAAAAADGAEAFDFYIRNMNPMTYNVPLDPVGTAYWLDIVGDLTPLPIPMTSWPIPWDPNYQVCPADHCSVWLFVNGGIVTELIEQYLP